MSECTLPPVGWHCPLMAGHPEPCQATPIGAVPVEHLQAMIRLLWPTEITPVAKRQLEMLCETYTP